MNPIKAVEVYSILGACHIYQLVNGCDATVSCDALPNGVYVVRTICENGVNSVNKFIR